MLPLHHSSILNICDTDKIVSSVLVLMARLELARPCGHQLLRLVCMPIPSHEHIGGKGGIRTLGTKTIVRRFSKPLHSTCYATSPYGGEGGIRTHGRFTVAGFQDQFLKPLGHLTILAGVEGLEPSTCGFGDRCSAKLNYTPILHKKWTAKNRRSLKIEKIKVRKFLRRQDLD